MSLTTHVTDMYVRFDDGTLRQMDEQSAIARDRVLLSSFTMKVRENAFQTEMRIWLALDPALTDVERQEFLDEINALSFTHPACAAVVLPAGTKAQHLDPAV